MSKYFLFVLLFLCQCQRADLDEIDNLRAGEIGVIGHGGSGYLSPEVNMPSNTATSVFKAIEGYGADGTEIDIQLSADSVLYLYHDNALESLTDCTGCVYETSSDQLDNCRYRAGITTNVFSEMFLVRLSDVIERFSDRDPPPFVFLDLKSLTCNYTSESRIIYNERLIRALKRLMATYNCYNWVILETTNRMIVENLTNAIPEAKVSFYNPLTSSNIDFAAAQGCFAMGYTNDGTTNISVREAQQQGLFVTIADVKIRSGAIEAVEKSPDFIYTDNIPMLQSVLDR